MTGHQESQDELVSIPETLEMAILWVPPNKDHSGKEEWIQQEVKRITSLWITPWRLYFDGFCTQHPAGAEIVINNPKGVQHCYSFLLDYQDTTNN